MSFRQLESPADGGLSHSLSRQAWQALAQAAQALAAVASAALGEACPSVPSAPPLLNHSPLSVPVALADVIRDYLRLKVRTECSSRYLRQLRVSLRSFARGKGRLSLHDVSPEMIQTWLERDGWAVRTRQGYLRDLRGLFRWAVCRGHLVRSPADAVSLPRSPVSTPPGIHSPAQVALVMRLALDRGPDLARLAALGYFAGIRTAELMRLGEEDINVGRGLVFVPAAKAKTRSRRLIVIQPNLAAWLRLEGRLPVSDGMRRLRAWRGACRRAGVPWPHNVARHSFVSYHLAAFGNAAKTALEAGHSEAMLFAHYRELVTPDAAEAFWGISPDPVP